MFKTLLGILFVLLSGTALAQTGDGMPPPNEGVCDELWGGTPGLYGLCVAFSEAQDCEPDFYSDNPFEHCNPSNPKLLEIYNKKKTESDPPMPGIAYDCPCWTDEELEGFRHPYGSPGETIRCYDGVTTNDLSHLTTVNTIGDVYTDDGRQVYTMNLGTHWSPIRGYRCHVQDICRLGDCLNIARFINIEEEELITCAAQVLIAAANRGIECKTTWP